jgi:hypothetical protein
VRASAATAEQRSMQGGVIGTRVRHPAKDTPPDRMEHRIDVQVLDD